ncbi:hypothetical protein F8388_017522 [Cannabis sativa]|uniref:Uncharacterized protein n=1 Tax=Cannabis sativa TaxID=3483 RepID=A0A7J6I9J6_CANSA|nr:hypothetical protein F8388_017522 [Cannabis sativa]KAF4403679.1 hypothetical protein G4B88_002532 [Cannabis sativa]
MLTLAVSHIKKVNTPEPKLIDEIVKDVLKKLGREGEEIHTVGTRSISLGATSVGLSLNWILHDSKSDSNLVKGVM